MSQIKMIALFMIYYVDDCNQDDYIDFDHDAY